MATTSLVLGIIGILCCVAPVGAFCSIISIILGVVAIKECRPNESRAKIGRTLGIIGICLSMGYILISGAMHAVMESVLI